MSDKTRNGRGMDDRDIAAKTRNIYSRMRSPSALSSSSAETDRLGREQQRRATAYARARGQL